jgi:DNA-binding transcriptional LysR family regulator
MKAIESFVTAAKSGSFNDAARHQRVSRAIVSRRIAELEDKLGVRLFHRTTRELSLTSAGQRYFIVCNRALTELDSEEETLSNLQKEPRGLLRITTSRAIGARHITSAVIDFMALYPEIQVEMELSSNALAITQLTKYGFDVGISTTRSKQSQSVARKISQFHSVLCASPAYFEQNGVPHSLKDLDQHRCLVNQRHSPNGAWDLVGDGRKVSLRIPMVLSITSVWAVREAALGGVGIAFLPTYAIEDDLRQGRLNQILPRYRSEKTNLYAVYPHFRMVPRRARIFTEFLQKRFEQSLWIGRDDR